MGLTEIDRLGDEIAEVAGHLNAAAHRLLTLPCWRFGRDVAAHRLTGSSR